MSRNSSHFTSTNVRPQKSIKTVENQETFTASDNMKLGYKLYNSKLAIPVSLGNVAIPLRIISISGLHLFKHSSMPQMSLNKKPCFLKTI